MGHRLGLSSLTTSLRREKSPFHDKQGLFRIGNTDEQHRFLAWKPERIVCRCYHSTLQSNKLNRNKTELTIQERLLRKFHHDFSMGTLVCSLVNLTIALRSRFVTPLGRLYPDGCITCS